MVFSSALSPSAPLSAAEEVLGPLSLLPIFSERVWGVESLPSWYPQPAAGKPIGEAWLSATECVVSDGAAAGKTLGELSRMFPKKFGATATGEFPLLVKTLFPREKLSVQVHPNDAQAQALGEPRGKTECWYVLSAEPGATVAVGFREPVTLDEIRTAIGDGTLEDKLRHVPVKAGDLVYVSAGTVHAIGPGVVVLETQQYSDSTYRLYDYGRPRELHVDAGLAVSDPGSDAGLKEPIPMEGFTRLIRSEYFAVDRFSSDAGEQELGQAGAMQMLFALADGSSVVSDSGVETVLKPGTVMLLPGEGVDYSLRVGAGESVIRIAQS